MTTTHHDRMIAGGFFFECACGECYTTARAAVLCRKCRSYAPDSTRSSTDLRTGETKTLTQVLWGNK